MTAPKTHSSPSATSASDAAKKAADTAEVKVPATQGAPVVGEPTVGPKEVPKLVDIGYGDLEPGETGFVKLDEHGAPIGEAQKADPNYTGPRASVTRPAKHPEQEVVTPAGAPVMSQMNPEPSRTMDPAFLARNPPGGTHDSSAAVEADGPSKGYQDDYSKKPTSEPPGSSKK